jgi:serine/threonine protein kinase
VYLPAGFNDRSHAETRMAQGTPSYMAPEQINNLPVDGRTDQFSLAVTAFEMLTGKRPFDADSLGALMYNILTKDPPLASHFVPALPLAVDAVLKQALAKSQTSRYATRGRFVHALESALINRKQDADLTRTIVAVSNPREES